MSQTKQLGVGCHDPQCDADADLNGFCHALLSFANLHPFALLRFSISIKP